MNVFLSFEGYFFFLLKNKMLKICFSNFRYLVVFLCKNIKNYKIFFFCNVRRE